MLNVLRVLVHVLMHKKVSVQFFSVARDLIGQGWTGRFCFDSEGRDSERPRGVGKGATRPQCSHFTGTHRRSASRGCRARRRGPRAPPPLGVVLLPLLGIGPAQRGEVWGGGGERVICRPLFTDGRWRAAAPERGEQSSTVTQSRLSPQLYTHVHLI